MGSLDEKMEGLVNSLKRMDLYRQTQRDLTKSTASGGTFSIFCVLCMMYLFYSELMLFLRVEVDHHMLVENGEKDTDEHHAEIQINMNISVPRVPCAGLFINKCILSSLLFTSPVLSVDAQDIMGSHIMDVGGRLHKTRIDANTLMPKLDISGRPLTVETGLEFSTAIYICTSNILCHSFYFTHCCCVDWIPFSFLRGRIR